MLVILGIVVFYDLMLKAYSLRSPGIIAVRRKCTSNWLYWNGIVRMFMEIYMNLTLFNFVSLVNLDWNTNLPAVNFSNTFAIVGTLVVFIAPVILLRHTWRNLHKFGDESFSKRHGAILEGVDLDYINEDKP